MLLPIVITLAYQNNDRFRKAEATPTKDRHMATSQDPHSIDLR
jgi:hypothetical protein